MFYFGAATSAHQVEGGNHNDWSEWEKETAIKKAHSAKKRKWPEYLLGAYPNPLSPRNYISEKACDHYHRFKEDFALARKLGHNAHRLSIEWSRIEPREGQFNEEEIAHYRAVIRELKKQKLEPFVTLWHWPLPVWLAHRGGWASKKTIFYFTRYVEKIVSALGDDAIFWLTLNEPEIYATNSYLKGVWPPEKKSIFTYLAVLRNLASAHREAYAIIKANNPQAQVGIAKNNIYYEAHKRRFVNKFFKRWIDWWWNDSFLNAVRNQLDFIGVNYYFHNRINYGFNKNENKLVSDMGWELYPQGIYHVLREAKKYEKPLYVTENGLADAEDRYREWFIRETLHHMRRAMKEGADVRGYFHWSLLDNFEWDKGFWPRFGLIEIDYKTMKRRVRKSALAYKALIHKWEKL